MRDFEAKYHRIILPTLTYIRYGRGKGIKSKVQKNKKENNQSKNMTSITITTKQEEILTLLYKYKFLNRIQIQTFLKHKDHRRINSWLKDLIQKQYINRIWSNSYYERTMPAIYYLAPNSLGYLERRYYITSKYFPKVAEEATLSENFISDSLFLADISLSFLTNKAEKVTLTAMTQTELAEFDSKYSFLAEARIKPSLIFAEKAGKKSMTKYYIYEMIDKYSSMVSIRSKIKKYFEMYYSGEWKNNVDGKFPYLYFVCPSLYLIIYAKRYARRIRSEDYEDADFPIKFAHAENVKSSGIKADIWEKA